MDPEQLLCTMERRAVALHGEVLAAAREEADAVLEQAREEAVDRRETALADLRRELAGRARKEHDLIEAKAGRTELALRHRAASEVLALVADELAREARAPGFGDVVVALLEEALPLSANGPLAVSAPPDRADRCKAWLKERGRTEVEVEGRPGLAGVIVEDSGPSFRTTNTLASRYERVQDEARHVCMTSLFGKG